ncbi:MAG: hypothetical protein IJ751_05095, partial [Oscillospiraceae bacterium]|nr:hypothetical protein [Oscillospiraceae bacterium]
MAAFSSGNRYRSKDHPPDSGAAKWKNGGDYNKWFAVIAAAVLGIGVYLVCHALGVGQTKPDYQFAYVGTYALPDDTAQALERALESLGSDCNGDGKVVVRLNQYPTEDSGSADSAMGQYANQVTLMGDLESCDSYFFLLADPDAFQRSYEVLANRDGSCPQSGDRRGMDKTWLWTDCPVLAGLELGGYEETVLGETAEGDGNTLVASLYLGRRCFYNHDTVKNQAGCEALWDVLTEGAG